MQVNSKGALSRALEQHTMTILTCAMDMTVSFLPKMVDDLRYHAVLCERASLLLS